MKRPYALGILAGLVIAAGEPAPAADIVFRHANVLPMDRNVVLSDYAVVVHAERIVWVGPDKEATIPDSATSIDATGKYLLPGLVDFHTHPEPSDLPSYTAYGVTTIAALDGEPLKWRTAHLSLPAVAPNLISATRIMDGRQPVHWHSYTVGSPADVPAIMDPMIANGAMMAKVYSNMTGPEMEAIVAHAHERGIPVIGHVPTKLPMTYVLGGNGLDMVAHSEELTHYLNAAPTDAEEQAVVDLVARNRIAVTPNLIVIQKLPGQATNIRAILSDPQSAFLPPDLYQEWLPRNNGYANRKNIPAFVAAIDQQLSVQEALTHKLADAGALLLAGTDAPDTCWPGVCLHEELALLSANGLGNFGALQAATFNAGVFAANEIRAFAADRFGVIAPGARADLLLVDANPVLDLNGLRRMTGLMIAGRWLDKATLETARQSELPLLARMHASVDRYEKLYTAGDMTSLMAFLDTLPSGAQWFFSEDVVCADAKRLAGAGNAAQGMALLSHLKRLLPQSIGVRNMLGRIALDAGDVKTAGQAFEDALSIAPRDAVSLQGLADTAARAGSQGRN
jgi:imidazolonepropionase-like amidohydrolase